MAGLGTGYWVLGINTQVQVRAWDDRLGTVQLRGTWR